MARQVWRQLLLQVLRDRMIASQCQVRNVGSHNRSQTLGGAAVCTSRCRLLDSLVTLTDASSALHNTITQVPGHEAGDVARAAVVTLFRTASH